MPGMLFNMLGERACSRAPSGRFLKRRCVVARATQGSSLRSVALG
jgi:hypothetical protein